MQYLTLHYRDPEQRTQLLNLLNSLFNSPEVKKSFGRPVSNDDTYTWVVAMDGEAVAGFSAIRIAKNGNAELRHTYVLPGYRCQGIATAMIARRIQIARGAGCRLIRTTINPDRIAKYPGFVEDIRRGKWLVIKMVLS